MSDQEQEAIPYVELEITRLPSRGVPYPKGAWVKYRTYSWGEVRKSSGSTSGVLEAVKTSLTGIMTSFDKNQLTVADALYLGIARKISTFSGLQIEVPYVCRGCGAAQKGVFTEKDITFRDLPAEVTELPAVVDIGGKTLEFAPMTVKQYLELNEGRWDKVTGGGPIDEVAIQSCWVKNMDFPEAYAHVAGLKKVEDFELMTEIDRLMRHDMERLKFTCKAKLKDGKDCLTVTPVRLEGREALLRPFRERKTSVSGRVRFGKRTEPANDNAGPDGVQSSNGAQV